MTLKEKIISEIKKVFDPEIPVNIYDLGLIYNIDLKDNKEATIKMTLTSPNCPVADSLPKMVKENILKIEELETVNVELVESTLDKRYDVRSCKIGIKFMSEKVIKLSDNAAKRIKEILSKANKPTIGVRVGVKSGGCAGMSYVMEYAQEIKPNEEVIEDKGVKVLIDPNAIMYLLGTEMDFK